MTEKTEITNPIEVKDNSKEKIAYDLMTLISSCESDSRQETASREYYLKLYAQCLKTIYRQEYTKE